MTQRYYRVNVAPHFDLNQFPNLPKPWSNVNAQDVSGNYLIHVAVLADHVELVNLLLDQGANPNVRNLAGETPVMLAVKNGYSIMLDLLFRHSASVNFDDILVMTSYLLQSAKH